MCIQNLVRFCQFVLKIWSDSVNLFSRFGQILSISLLSNDSVYARIGTVDSGENRIGKSFKMAALYQKRVDTFPKLG